MKMRTLALVAGLAFASSAAFAADAPRPAPRGVPTTAAVAEPWTGFFIGAHAGWSRNDVSGSISPFGAGPFSASPNADGWLYGGHVGVQKQYRGLVIGVELDLSKVDASGSAAVSGTGGTPVTATSHLDWLATGRAKLGLDMGHWLPYVTAGGACGRHSVTLATPAFGGFSITSDEATACGWAAGAGLDWRPMGGSLVVSVDYTYADLGSSDVAFKPGIGGGAGISVPVDRSSHIIKGKLSLLF